MGNGWRIIQDWLDAQPFKVHDRQLATALGVSQNSFVNWKNPKNLPSRETLGAIAKVTGRPFDEVRDAFLSDLGMDDPPTEEEILAAQAERRERARRKGPPKSAERDKAWDEQIHESQDPGGDEPA